MPVHVGVREFRENLSRWLDRAAMGEEIVVTERGKPKARVGPTAVESVFDRLEREGALTRATKPRKPISEDDLIPVSGSVTEILLEQRRQSR